VRAGFGLKNEVVSTVKMLSKTSRAAMTTVGIHENALKRPKTGRK